MTLVELLVSLVLFGGLLVGGKHLLENYQQGNKKYQIGTDLSGIRTQIISVLQNTNSFNKTLEHYANKTAFSCIQEAKNCKGTKSEFKIFRAKQTGESEIEHVSLSSESNKGFKKDGSICYLFNAINGSDECPFKYVATWEAVCPPAVNTNGQTSVETKCRNPIFNILVKLHAHPKNPKTLANFVPQKFDIRLALSQSASDQNKLCNIVGNGYYDEATSSCIFFKSGKTTCETHCPAGSNVYVSGFYSDGSLKCECTPVAALNCNTPGSAGKVLLGVNDSGVLTCGEGLIAGLNTSGAINHSPQSYATYLNNEYNTALADLNVKKNNAAVALNSFNTAKLTYDSAVINLNTATNALKVAKQASNANPTDPVLAQNVSNAEAAMVQAQTTYETADLNLKKATSELAAANDAVVTTQTKVNNALKAYNDQCKSCACCTPI
jgi:hypothetical protein